MAFKVLDYGAVSGAEGFETTSAYADGEQRWAARSDWFIRFWGYVIEEQTRANTIDPGTGRYLLFVDSATGKLTIRTTAGYELIGADVVASITNVDSPYSATAESLKGVILADASSGAITINLPAVASSTGQFFTIKKTDTSANAVTVDGNSTETIDGDETKILSQPYSSMQLYCDGSNWYIL